MALKWWGPEGGLSPDAGGPRNPAGMDCRFTGPATEPKHRNILGFTGLSGRRPTTRHATLAAIPVASHGGETREGAAPDRDISDATPHTRAWTRQAGANPTRAVGHPVGQ